MLKGGRPDRLRHPAAEELEGLFDVADIPLDRLHLVRCLTTIEDVLTDPGSAIELLERLGERERTVRSAVLVDIYPRLAQALDGIAVEPPVRVRVAPELTVERDEAVLLDAPYLLPLLDRIPVPARGLVAAVADLLDLPLASEVVTAAVTSTATSVSNWSELPGAGIAARRLGMNSLPGRIACHDPLVVTGDRVVSWWTAGGMDHVHRGTGPDALGRALAWRHGAWSLRAALAEAFAHPDDLARLTGEDAAG